MPLDDKARLDLLRAISLSGDSNINPIVASSNHIQSILNLSSGLPRINNPAKFSMIFQQPLTLAALNPLEIRCCLCRKVVSYPAWYYVAEFTVNVIHYFVCMNADGNKVSANCYRR